MTHHIAHFNAARSCGLAVFGAVTIACVATPLAQSTFPVLRPVDAAAARPDFFTFRARLQAALDYRAIFSRTSTGWQMTAFIAGD